MAKRLPVKSLKNVHQHRYILQKIANASRGDRKKMLLNAPAELFRVFKTLCKFVSDGHLKLGRAGHHKNLVHKVSKAKTDSIKGLAKQHGGAIASIIAGVLPFLTPLLKKIFK